MNLSSKSETWIGRLNDHSVSSLPSKGCQRITQGLADPQDKTFVDLCGQKVVLSAELELDVNSSSVEHPCHSLLHGSANVDHTEVDHEDNPLLGWLCCHMHLREMVRQHVVGLVDGLQSSHMSPSRHALLANQVLTGLWCPPILPLSLARTDADLFPVLVLTKNLHIIASWSLVLRPGQLWWPPYHRCGLLDSTSDPQDLEPLVCNKMLRHFTVEFKRKYLTCSKSLPQNQKFKPLMQKTDVEHVEIPPLCVEQKNAQKKGHVVKRNYCWGYVVLHIHTAADCAVGLVWNLPPAGHCCLCWHCIPML